MSILDKVRVIVYRFHEKGLEVFLLDEHLKNNPDIWKTDKLKVCEIEKLGLTCDHIVPCDHEDVETIAVEADWQDIPSIKGLIKTDIKIAKEVVKETIPGVEQGAYVAIKEVMKKAAPDHYKALKELKDTLFDVYTVDDQLIMVASDRISAFDHVLPRAIPYKGQVLNQLSVLFLNESKDIVPNWLVSSPHPNVSIGKKCEPIMLEMVIRGYLAGHAWREYKSGKRSICGVPMPDGMKESDKFPEPIITPATKAEEGHDEDISREQILSRGIVSEAVLDQLEDHTRALFQYGTERATKQGLILVDTKYEFGIYDEEILLMDEIHTPDSSRYYYADGYQERQVSGERQKQLSKEFVREWLMENGFQGKEGHVMPEMPDEFVNVVTDKYIELYEKVTGVKFQRNKDLYTSKSIKEAVLEYLK